MPSTSSPSSAPDRPVPAVEAPAGTSRWLATDRGLPLRRAITTTATTGIDGNPDKAG